MALMWLRNGLRYSLGLLDKQYLYSKRTSLT